MESETFGGISSRLPELGGVVLEATAEAGQQLPWALGTSDCSHVHPHADRKTMPLRRRTWTQVRTRQGLHSRFFLRCIGVA